jgi:hypothetical protein
MTRLTVSPNVIYEELEGQVVLLQLEGGRYYQLNESGARIWALIQEHGELEKVQKAMADEYDVDAEVAHRDVERIVEELTTRGMVTVEQP